VAPDADLEIERIVGLPVWLNDIAAPPHTDDDGLGDSIQKPTYTDRKAILVIAGLLRSRRMS
jgi:hypothetical protein